MQILSDSFAEWLSNFYPHHQCRRHHIYLPPLLHLAFSVSLDFHSNLNISAAFYMFSGYVDILFHEAPVQTFAHFPSRLSVVFIDFRSPLCILNIILYLYHVHIIYMYLYT